MTFVPSVFKIDYAFSLCFFLVESSCVQILFLDYHAPDTLYTTSIIQNNIVYVLFVS